MFLINQNKNILYQRLDKSEGIFRVNVTEPGTYAIIFSNYKVNIKQV